MLHGALTLLSGEGVEGPLVTEELLLASCTNTSSHSS